LKRKVPWRIIPEDNDFIEKYIDAKNKKIEEFNLSYKKRNYRTKKRRNPERSSAQEASKKPNNNTTEANTSNEEVVVDKPYVEYPPITIQPSAYDVKYFQDYDINLIKMLKLRPQ
jgi:hypothetical protein